MPVCIALLSPEKGIILHVDFKSMQVINPRNMVECNNLNSINVKTLGHY
jgi:hypothetical protein